MATEVYKIITIYTIEKQPIEISPLKIKYLKEFMGMFDYLKHTRTDDEAINLLSDCVRVAMKQYYPDLSKNISDIQDNFDLKTIYQIIDIGAGIKIGGNEEKIDKEEIVDKKGSTWDTLDLAKLETEAFLLGIWKNYDELESSLCIQELMTILSINRELEYEEKKFLAALQGINLENSASPNKGQKEWEDLKARVFSKGAATDSKDILALQGQNAKKAGFGIGMGLDYEDLRTPTNN